MMKHTCEYTRDELIELLTRAAIDIMRLQAQRDTAMLELRTIREHSSVNGIFRHYPRQAASFPERPAEPVAEAREDNYNPTLSLNVRYPVMIRKPRRAEQP
jgi:hypothetical protein